MFRRELKPMLSLALPVIIGEIGWTSMGLVDTLMVGPLGPAAIGAVGLGSVILIAISVGGMGLLLGLDTLVAQSFGAGRIDRCHHWLVQGLYLAAMVAVPLTALGYLAVAGLPALGLAPDVLPLAGPYLAIAVTSIPALLVYAAFRRYLQAMNRVRPVMIAMVSANVVNAVVNAILIYGMLGAPELGVAGAAWATVASRCYMAIVLLVAVRMHDRRFRTNLGEVSRRIAWPDQRTLLTLGVPAAVHVTLEVSVFALVTALAGRLSSAALAAHQIALNIWSVVFMVPLGLNAAGAVRVGQAVGRSDPAGARHAGWMAFALGGGFTTVAAAVFLLAGPWLIGWFSADATVMTLGPSLLGIAGLCLVFDGTQGIATGVLRGLGDTRTPAVLNLVGLWFVGLPLAYVASFRWDWGVQGLWLGLAAGLVLVGVTLLVVWTRRARGLTTASGVASCADVQRKT